MSRRRIRPDGLPYRVYERFGKRLYSIGYKQPDNQWAFRYTCSVGDSREIRAIRQKAIAQSLLVTQGIAGRTEGLIDAWFKWQNALPAHDLNRRAESTLQENEREAKNLKRAFGHMDPAMITKTDGYAYLDACAKAGRPIKGNKEMALLQVILEYGIRLGRLSDNPLQKIRKNRTQACRRYVSDEDLALVVAVGRAKGGAYHIIALALKTAYLCVRRSVEIRRLKTDAISEEGMLWHDGKSKTKPAILMVWTDELRKTIHEALAIQRYRATTDKPYYLFGNLAGNPYTKGGWKTMLGKLMKACIQEAQEQSMTFTPFSLQDCRPKGVSDKLSSGQTDTQTATGHTNDRMIRQVYDRRMVKRARPVQ